jgi:prepilin-type processing-associated H-X9-DG protein
MLPFMEGGTSYAACNFAIPGDLYPNIHAGSHPNFTALYQLVSSYLCPSDTQASADMLQVNYTARRQGSYAENRGRQENILFNWAVSAYPDPGQPYYGACNYGGGDGMFMPSSVVRIADVSDGMSNTFFFGEQSRFKNEYQGSQFSWVTLLAAWNDPGWGWTTQVFGTTGVRITAGAFVIPKLNAPPDLTGATCAACFNNCVQPPDWLQNSAIPGGPCIMLGQWGFHSMHPGGGNFAMADGSVRFVKESVNLVAYRALGTRNLNEVVSSDSY